MLPRETAGEVMLVRRVRLNGPRQFSRFAAAVDPERPVDVTVTESTAVKGMLAFVAGSVLAHVAVRLVDAWFFDRRK